MRRTKEWWARLTAEERQELVSMEHGNKYDTPSGHLPEGYSGCPVCSTPTYGGGFCHTCYSRWEELVKKGDGDARPLLGPLSAAFYIEPE